MKSTRKNTPSIKATGNIGNYDNYGNYGNNGNYMDRSYDRQTGFDYNLNNS